VADGALVLEPYPYGQGGLLLSDRSYKDFELYLEARPDPGYNSGIFLRSTEGGSAQAQWKAVMKTNPSIFQAGKVSDDAERHPVENVTWEDAQAFVRRLNALEKTHVYRLPTEFEWEYAARAGEDADTPWTVIRERAVAGYNAFFTTQMVGSKQPNAWGPYDMQGNVWEWVQDYYNEKPFADPTPPRSGKVRVLKGGGFAADVKNAIPATHAAGPGSKFDVGFRIVRETKP
jgi:formylglycine-generating enzyme required for sulfatase activity